MVDGHGRDAWSHTATLCALIANTNRDPKKGRAFRPEDFDPYARDNSGQVIEVTADNIGDVKQMFTNHQAAHPQQKGF